MLLRFHLNCAFKSQVELVPAAVSNSSGSCTFIDTADGVSHIVSQATATTRGEERYDVPQITLDDFTRDRGIDSVDFLKVDAEGYDLHVLEGASRLPVDHSRGGFFLINYFFADSVDQNLSVWNYTAGWFQAETGLDNSTVLLPIDPYQSKYSIFNHCRWDSLGQILPSLIFKRSFHSYVLDNFAANNIAAVPILYRLA